MLLTVIILYRYRLKTRHHKFSEKSKHFGYLDYFTYPVCQHQGCVQRSPDNRDSTASRMFGCQMYSYTGQMSEDNPIATSLQNTAFYSLDMVLCFRYKVTAQSCAHDFASHLGFPTFQPAISGRSLNLRKTIVHCINFYNAQVQITPDKQGRI